MKKCSKCNINKPLSDFQFSRPNVLRANCKQCQNLYNKNYRLKNKSKVKEWNENRVEYRKQYNIDNKEKRNEYLKKWSKDNPLKKRGQKYRHRYKIDIKDYNDMLDSQGGKCKICESTDYGRKNAEYFVIDHCHASNKVRGLLCHKCNMVLGLCKDNISILKQAIIYLNQTF